MLVHGWRSRVTVATRVGVGRSGESGLEGHWAAGIARANDWTRSALHNMTVIDVEGTSFSGVLHTETHGIRSFMLPRLGNEDDRSDSKEVQKYRGRFVHCL